MPPPASHTDLQTFRDGLIDGRSSCRHPAPHPVGTAGSLAPPSPWRDLPELPGGWNGVFRRFSRESRKGTGWRLFEAVADDPDSARNPVAATVPWPE